MPLLLTGVAKTRNGKGDEKRNKAKKKIIIILCDIIRLIIVLNILID